MSVNDMKFDKKTKEKLGIVATPPEVVDFILRSVDDVLQKEFGRRLTDEDVNILDPFTGDGIFIQRLIDSDLIDDKDLTRKYDSEIRANDILPVCVEAARVNIEDAYERRTGTKRRFAGLELKDTFEEY